MSQVSGAGVGGEAVAAEVREGLCCEQQNRCHDSVAIAETSQRPRLHAVSVKSVSQQDLTMLHALRQQALIDDLVLQEGLDLNQVSDGFWAVLSYEVR